MHIFLNNLNKLWLRGFGCTVAPTVTGYQHFFSKLYSWRIGIVQKSRKQLSVASEVEPEKGVARFIARFARFSKCSRSDGSKVSSPQRSHLAWDSLSLSIIITSFFCNWKPTATVQAAFLMSCEGHKAAGVFLGSKHLSMMAIRT